MGVGAGHHHLAGLQGLAQGIQSLGAELRQFVQEQHPVVGQRHLARLDPQAAAGQGRHGGRVVRGAEGPGAGQLALGDQAGHRVDHRGLQQLGRRQRRQQARQTGGHHRLPRARRPDEQQVVSAGRGDLQGALGVLLALDVPQVGNRPAVDHAPGRGRRQHLGPAEMVDHRDQRRGRQNAGLARPGGFGSAGLGADQAQAQSTRRDGRGQGAGRRHDPPVQGQFAHGGPAGQGVGRDDAHGRHHRQRDGQVVVAALLGQVGGRQVADDAPSRHGQAQAGEGGADPLAALGHGLVAESHQHELLFAAGELHLHVHRTRLDPLERDGDDARGHAPYPRNRLKLSTTPARAAGRIKNKCRTFWENETIP